MTSDGQHLTLTVESLGGVGRITSVIRAYSVSLCLIDPSATMRLEMDTSVRTDFSATSSSPTGDPGTGCGGLIGSSVMRKVSERIADRTAPRTPTRSLPGSGFLHSVSRPV